MADKVWKGKVCGTMSSWAHQELVNLLLDGDAAIDGDGAVWITSHTNSWIKFASDGTIEIGKEE